MLNYLTAHYAASIGSPIYFRHRVPLLHYQILLVATTACGPHWPMRISLDAGVNVRRPTGWPLGVLSAQFPDHMV